MSFSCILVQFNFNVGHIAANRQRIEMLYDMAVAANVDLIIFSEMAITGYPPEDMVLCQNFQQTSMQTVIELASMTANGPAMIIGGLWHDGNALYNTVFLLSDGHITHRQYKHHLPNYGVFDEKRLFSQGPLPEPVTWRGIKLGLLVCEDIWLPDVTAHLKDRGAELLISIHASPYETGKALIREQIAADRACETGLPLIYVNQVGGQDETIFDGGSFVVEANGEICMRMKAFEPDFSLLRFQKHEKWQPEPGVITPIHDEIRNIYHAMTLGLRDFVSKNGFLGIVLGLSGGIDSALSAAVAVDALGKEQVRAVMIPSPFTSQESIDDATECAALLGIRFDIIPIEPGMEAFVTMISSSLKEGTFMVATQRNQSRLRNNILMAIAESERFLLMNTCNKSETAVGFTTIYGDMGGHYSVLKDVYKTTVYAVAEWRNTQGKVIPRRIFTKAPSAELAHNQKDQDILPPYELLDEMLFKLIEEARSAEELIAEGYDHDMTKKMAYMVFLAEYKRFQSPPGVKITPMLFGRDRRYPITNGWRGLD